MAAIKGIDSYKLQTNHRPVQDSSLSGSAGSSGSSAVSHVKNPEEVKNNVLLSLVKGQTVKGEVTDLLNNNVKLLLSDGRTLSATLKNISTLSIGDTASFKVLSATNANIALKLEGNPVRNTLLSTITRALSAAGLQINDKNSEAVSELMRAGLPIKASSVLGIIEASGNHPNASFQTLARLTQLELPITAENVALVEAYNNHELSIQDSVTGLSDRVYTAFTETLNGAGSASAAAVQGGADTVAGAAAALGTADATGIAGAAGALGNADAAGIGGASGLFGAADTAETVGTEGAPGTVNDTGTAGAAGASGENGTAGAGTGNFGAANNINSTDSSAAMRTQLFNTILGLGDGSTGTMPLSGFLSENQLSALNNMLAGVGTANGVLLEINQNMSLNDLAAMLGADNPAGSAAFNAASATPEFAAAVSTVLERHWSLSPAELLEGKNRPEELAKQILRESENVSRVLKAFEDSIGKQASEKQGASSEARSAVDFAGLVNEIYPYVQIPVELRGGTVHSELFVYRKKNGGPLNKEDKISVMIHLDMEALGPLDVRVEMNRENISTKFFVNDAVSEKLINDNLPLLDKALSDKGYIFSGEVDGARVGRNPLEDFIIGHDSGQVKRYTFDIRT